MRLLVNKQGIFAEIFRVNFYKSKNWNVIGEHLLFDYLEELIPTGIKFHSHFIYVENGDYHYSIKYFDTAQNLYVDRKTYWNHIAIRKGPSPDFTRETPIERRDINPVDPLDCFMMGERLKPWTERPLGHHFGTVALNLTAAHLPVLPWDEKISLAEDDLVIDLNQVGEKIANFGVGLFSQGNIAFELDRLPPEVKVLEKAINRNDLVLRLSVIIAE